MRRAAIPSVVLVAVVSALLVFAAAAAARPAGNGNASPASVTVVHGLRGLVADVLLDGQPVLQGFTVERATDPLEVPPGSHEVVVRRSSDPAGPPVVTTTVELVSGESRSLVVHPGPVGAPVLTSFANDGPAVPAGSGRLVLRNTADTPPVQMVVDGQPVGDVLSNGSGVDTVLSAGPHSIAVRSPEGSELLGAVQTVVPAGVSTLLYLIGSQADGDLNWLVQSLESVARPPAGVPTGDSGLKPGAGATEASTGSVAGPVIAVLVLGGLAATARRPRRRA